MTPVNQVDRGETRRTRKGEARDACLRRRAADLFLARGYDDVTIDELVREVGGSKTGIYGFYGGKEGLFLAVMNEVLHELAAPIRALALTDLSLEAGLESFARALIAVLLQDRHLAFQRLVIAEAMRHPQLGRSWFELGPMTSRAVLAEYLRSQQARGHIATDVAPARLAKLFHDMITFDLLNRAMMGIAGGLTPAEIAQTIADAVRVMMQGVATGKPIT